MLSLALSLSLFLPSLVLSFCLSHSHTNILNLFHDIIAFKIFQSISVQHSWLAIANKDSWWTNKYNLSMASNFANYRLFNLVIFYLNTYSLVKPHTWNMTQSSTMFHLKAHNFRCIHKVADKNNWLHKTMWFVYAKLNTCWVTKILHRFNATIERQVDNVWSGYYFTAHTQYLTITWLLKLKIALYIDVHILRI